MSGGCMWLTHRRFEKKREIDKSQRNRYAKPDIIKQEIHPFKYTTL